MGKVEDYESKDASMIIIEQPEETLAVFLFYHILELAL